MAYFFRDLRADEIECRVARCTERCVTILLYKDARCDQNILDETVGMLNWEKSYQLIDGQLFCTISIWDEHKKHWISKQDVGVESNTEAEKGRASDAQKRAAFAFGIGRELYTAPEIYITPQYCRIVENKNGNKACYDKFRVSHIVTNNGVITSLQIVNDSKGGQVVFAYGNQPETPEHTPSPAAQNAQDTVKIGEQQLKILEAEMIVKGVTAEQICQRYKVATLSDLTAAQYVSCMRCLKATNKNKEE